VAGATGDIDDDIDDDIEHDIDDDIDPEHVIDQHLDQFGSAGVNGQRVIAPDPGPVR
jgi:hypothetical protein